MSLKIFATQPWCKHARKAIAANAVSAYKIACLQDVFSFSHRYTWEWRNSTGASTFSAIFTKEGENPPHVANGTLAIHINDEKVGEGKIRTQPGRFSLAGEGLNVGRDGGEPVTPDYPGKRPWVFTSTVKRVIVDVSGELKINLEVEAYTMLIRE